MPILGEDQVLEGTVIQWHEPNFRFTVQLDDGNTILCGLIGSYFGRMLPSTAIKRIRKSGPQVGQRVRISKQSDESMGVILRPRSS